MALGELCSLALCYPAPRVHVCEHHMCACKHTSTTRLALFFQPQMFPVANSHKMPLFRQFFPCCYLISSLTNYSKLFAFLIPEVISLSAGGSHPAHYHRLASGQPQPPQPSPPAALKISTRGAGHSPPLAAISVQSKGHRDPVPTPQSYCSPRPIPSPVTKRAVYMQRVGQMAPEWTTDVKPSSAASVDESWVSRSLPSHSAPAGALGEAQRTWVPHNGSRTLNTGRQLITISPSWTHHSRDWEGREAHWMVPVRQKGTGWITRGHQILRAV